ncbi:hypothetical protein RRG08_035264 [Elysia crispata]|uniref:Uncharacterized protein n=1 Tax=Elysia crispata TaxID=231223 RepID=A0AAE1AGJ9_9GAST|nr:hypothetical protein RRG08_035264 [Elysia crispata]
MNPTRLEAKGLCPANQRAISKAVGEGEMINRDKRRSKCSPQRRPLTHATQDAGVCQALNSDRISFAKTGACHTKGNGRSATMNAIMKESGQVRQEALLSELWAVQFLRLIYICLLIVSSRSEAVLLPVAWTAWDFISSLEEALELALLALPLLLLPSTSTVTNLNPGSNDRKPQHTSSLKAAVVGISETLRFSRDLNDQGNPMTTRRLSEIEIGSACLMRKIHAHQESAFYLNLSSLGFRFIQPKNDGPALE